MGNVLVADDDAAIRTVLHQALARAGHVPRVTGNVSTLWRWVAQGEGDLIITDVVMPDGNAFDLLPRIKKARPELPIVVMSAQNTLLTAVTAAEHGAYEYLPKPFDLNELLAVVARAIEAPKASSRPAPASDDEQLPLVGRSPAMQEIYRVMARLTQSDLTVMILGESGTGKELVARALHDYSRRRRAPFVPINMAAIPRELIESELFGHEKGAFTGAQARNIGRFEQAEGGTLFLDEIGDMPMEAQTRLLRVLQEGEYTTVGGRVALKTDVRIIAATNRDLRQLIDQGVFREDLFYRLNVVPLRLPPLRERMEDIPDLVQHFLRRDVANGLPDRTFESQGLDALQSHTWPGNVRELENIIHRMVALSPHDVIGRDAVLVELASSSKETSDHFVREGADCDLAAYTERYMADHLATYGAALPPPGLYQRVLHEIEVPLISAVLNATRGNQIKAAEVLGLNRNTLRKKIRDLDIEVVRSPAPPA